MNRTGSRPAAAATPEHSDLHGSSHGPVPNPALYGATRAFLPAAMPTQPLHSAGPVANGALAAATRAGRPAASTPSSVRPGETGGAHSRGAHVSSLKAGRDAMARSLAGSPASRERSYLADRRGQPSPSLIAANLAASKATSTSLPPTPRAVDRAVPRRPDGTRSDDDEVDDSQILSTQQLITAFEKKQTRAASPARPRLTSRTSSPRAIVSPVPVRPSIPLLASRRAAETHSLLYDAKPAPPAPPKKPAALTRTRSQPALKPMGRSSRAHVEEMDKLRIAPRKTERQFSASSEHSAAQASEAGKSSDGSFTSARDEMESPTTASKPLLAKARPPPQPAAKAEAVVPPPLTLVTPRRPSSTLTYSSYTTPQLKPQLTADSLADAIVASSLASSRLPSPTRASLPSSPPLWTTHHYYLGANRGPGALAPPSAGPVTRTPSPLKSMRQTLRRSPEGERSGRGGERTGARAARSKSHDGGHSPTHPHPHAHRRLLVRKHAHKHAEGDRRRWRDAISAAERKRYEGVWAANRGLVAAATLPDEVHAYVVRDLWQRSGLGTPVLAEVWELVADGGGHRRLRPPTTSTGAAPAAPLPPEEKDRRTLRREEFVVGMWLVDQCLKGRRLPIEVGESVWASARQLLPGMRVR